MPATLAKNCKNWSEEDCSVCGQPWEDYHVAYDDFCGRGEATPDPIDRIEQIMGRRGLSRKDLEPMIGSRGRVAEILNRKRKLSLDMIRNLNKKLGVSADHLIVDYDLQ